MIAPLACRYLEVPRVGNLNDIGIVFPRDLERAAFRAFAKFNDAPFADPKKRKSEAISLLEFLGPTFSFRDDGGDVIATLALSKEEIRKLADLARQLCFARTELRKLAGKLRFAQTAVMGRLGRAAWRPSYEPFTEGGGSFPEEVKGRLRCWGFALPAVAPRLMTSAVRTQRLRPDQN